VRNFTQTNKPLIYGGIGIILLVIAFGFYQWLESDRELARVSHERMTTTFNLLHLGMSIDEVETAIKRCDWPEESYSISRSANLGVIHTPMEIGAMNWILHLVFDDRGSLASIRVRTDNASCEHPREAPKDVDLEGFSHEEMKATELKWEH
jgi:hypothetical protein